MYLKQQKAGEKVTTDLPFVEGLYVFYISKKKTITKNQKKNNDLQIPTMKTASSTGSKVTADVMPRKNPVFALVVVSEAK